MSRVLVLSALILTASAVVAQSPPASQQKWPNYAAIPAEVAKQQNPVKSSSESLARAKKWWTLDCTMCHGNDGNGKSDIAKDAKWPMKDFTDPATLKERTDGELFYIIKNGIDEMPPEGPRVKTEENWDLVNYVRSLAKKKAETASEQKPSS
ncbi:MAG TPA: cytochrome c [Candidatus Sulfotelmatobacter sp.]|nr:cytochrome c [Candidatus Sulfotelmatobacter sp.]